MPFIEEETEKLSDLLENTQQFQNSPFTSLTSQRSWQTRLAGEIKVEKKSIAKILLGYN